MKKLRLSLGLNQSDFWRRVGVSQSAGSRYEGGRPVPMSTKILIDLVYGKRPLVTLAKLRQI